MAGKNELIDEMKRNIAFSITGFIILIGITLMAVSTFLQFVELDGYYEAVESGNIREMVDIGKRGDLYSLIGNIGILFVFIGIMFIAFGLERQNFLLSLIWKRHVSELSSVPPELKAPSMDYDLRLRRGEEGEV